MATPNKTVPHWEQIFQNPKTHLLSYSFKKRVTPAHGLGEGPQLGFLFLNFPHLKIKIKSKWRLQTIPCLTSKISFPFYFLKYRVAPICKLGEGPQIGDSARDRTQNLWFHKRIKLELELGILEHMVL